MTWPRQEPRAGNQRDPPPGNQREPLGRARGPPESWARQAAPGTGRAGTGSRPAPAGPGCGQPARPAPDHAVPGCPVARIRSAAARQAVAAAPGAWIPVVRRPGNGASARPRLTSCAILVTRLRAAWADPAAVGLTWEKVVRAGRHPGAAGRSCSRGDLVTDRDPILESTLASRLLPGIWRSIHRSARIARARGCGKAAGRRPGRSVIGWAAIPGET
jgi:hypothetical protein